MDKVQEHIEKVREALQDTEKSATHADYQNAVRRISMMANTWLSQSLDIIEQQQREIESLQVERDKAIEGLRKCMRVTADGSIPDEWDHSTGGGGHAEIRKIVRSILSDLGVSL